MIIAKEYGYDPDLSGVKDSQVQNLQISRESKDKPSEFDMLLSFFQNSSIGKSTTSELGDAKDLSIAGGETHKVDEKDSNPVVENTRREDNSVHEIDPAHKKDVEKPNSYKKENLLDAGYVSEINKKVNGLLEKIRKTTHPSEAQTRMVASELQVLLLQFQKFAGHIHKGIAASRAVSTTTDMAKNSQNKLMTQLLQRMTHKLNTAKELLKEMELSSKSLASKVVSTQRGIDLRLLELKSVDEELSKTIHLLKDLKKISQEGQSVLHRAMEPKSQASFVSANFSPELSHAGNKNSSAHKLEMPGLNTAHHGAQKIESTPINPPFSGGAGEHSRKDEGAYPKGNWNIAGVSGGVLQLKSSGEFLPTAALSNMSFQDKLLLGQEVLNQMGQGMKGEIGKHESHLSISLKPEELGDVKIMIDMKDGVIKSHIVVQNDLVKDLLKDRFEDVKNLFLQNGVNVSEFGIHTQEEFQQQQGSSRESVEGIFETQRHLAGQVKLQRYAENSKESYWAYEKMDDTQTELKNFTIVI